MKIKRISLVVVSVVLFAMTAQGRRDEGFNFEQQSADKSKMSVAQ